MVGINAQVYVSWDGSAAFTGPYDRVTADVAADPGLVVDAGLDGQRALSPPKVASLDFELFNHTGRYSQERADSPVYQRVIPGRPVSATISYGVTDAYRSANAYRASDPYRGSATYRIGRTTIDDLSQQTAYGSQRVAVTTLGIEALLNNTTISVPLTQSIRVDQAIGLVLDRVSWPTAKRRLSVADTSLLWFYVDGETPWSVLLKLLAAEGPGLFYVNGEAEFVFQNRNYRTTAGRATTSQAVLFDRTVAPSDAYRAARLYREADPYRGAGNARWFVGLSYDPGFKTIRNRATYSVQQRQAGSVQPVWTYLPTVTLTGASPSVTLVVRPTDPFVNAVVPSVAGGDFTVTGGGTVTAALSTTSGVVTFLTLTLASGPSSTVSALRMRAQPLTVVSANVVTNNVDASGSIARFSPIPGAAVPVSLQVDGYPEVDEATGISVCNAWVVRYQLPRPSVTILLRGVDDEHTRLILSTEVSDRLTIVERNTGLSGDVWVNSKRLTVAGARGQTLLCELGCERVDEVEGFVWDGATTLWDHALWGI